MMDVTVQHWLLTKYSHGVSVGEAISRGVGLWTFNTTGHGDQFQTQKDVYGLFAKDSSGALFFLSNSPVGPITTLYDPEELFRVMRFAAAVE
jgi:hypothetical protein